MIPFLLKVIYKVIQQQYRLGLPNPPSLGVDRGKVIARQCGIIIIELLKRIRMFAITPIFKYSFQLPFSFDERITF